MAVRTAYVPVAATAITAANHIKFPGGWIGYVEVTANQTGISSITDLTSLTLTVTVGSARRLKISSQVKTLQNGSGGTSEVSIRTGAGTTLNRSTETRPITSFATHFPVSVQTPSSGANTYKLSLLTGAGTVDLTADATGPSFLLIEDIGPA